MADNIDSLDLNDLRAARAILRHVHLGRAAVELGKTPSAMSHTLRRLRACFGDELLVRQGRDWVLTPLALEMQPELERTFLTFSRFAASGANFRPDDSVRRFVIATVDYTELVLLPPLLTAMRRLAPRCAIDVVRPQDVLRDLESGRVDLLLAPRFELPGDQLVVRDLSADRLVLVGRREAVRKIRSRKDFARAAHALTSPRGGLRTEVDEALGSLGDQRHVVFSSPSFVVPALAAVSSDVVAAIPRRLAMLLAPKLGLSVVEHPVVDVRFVMAMIWHPRMRAEPAHRWLRELVVEHCAAPRTPRVRNPARYPRSRAD